MKTASLRNLLAKSCMYLATAAAASVAIVSLTHAHLWLGERRLQRLSASGTTDLQEESEDTIRLHVYAQEMGLLPSRGQSPLNSAGGEKGQLARYIEDQVKAPTDQVEAPLPNLRRYLSSNAEWMADIRALLQKGVSLKWKSGVDRQARDLILPPVGEILNVQRVLLADGFYGLSAGTTARAESDLESSILLNQAVLARDEILSQLVAMRVSKFQLALARKMNRPVPERIDFSSRILSTTGRTGELLRSYQDSLPGWKDGLLAFLIGSTMRPSVRSDVLSFSRQFPDELKRLLAAHDPCRVSLDSHEMPVALRSNAAAYSVWPDYASAIVRAGNIEIDHELTSIVLAARGHAASDVPSRVCRQGMWVMRDAGSDRLVALSGQANVEDEGLMLPLYHLIGPRTPESRHAIGKRQ
jgi:hypothetical protein